MRQCEGLANVRDKYNKTVLLVYHTHKKKFDFFFTSNYGWN